MENKNQFYPTPTNLIIKMWSKLDKERINYLLEPSAGKGHILNFTGEKNRRLKTACIEIDPEFQAILKDKGYNLIDSDFLSYSGLDRFDCIMMNPPFANGEAHLLKAINLMFNGQIVCLLNAETLKNPFSNTRRELVKKLSELGAEIEYIENGFIDAERKTAVETALIYLDVKRDIETVLFDNLKEAEEPEKVEIEESGDIEKRNRIDIEVGNYEKDIEAGFNTIKTYFQNYSRISSFIGLDCEADKNIYYSDKKTLNEKVNEKINNFIERVRNYYWRKTLDFPEVNERISEKVRERFLHQIKAQCKMDFSRENIRQFIINLIGDYNNMLMDSVLEVFNRMSEKYNWLDETSKNTYLYNGWKTNKSWFVNKKVVLPVYSYSHPFIGYSGEWRLNNRWDFQKVVGDIDKVMNYFDGRKHYTSIVEAVERALEEGINRNIESTYFKISVFKKQTIHLTFKDENIRRRFNVMACKGKNWLPPEYGTKNYHNMTEEEKNVVDSFEGQLSYSVNLNQIGFKQEPELLQLTG
jgi:hypothetical protein